MIPLFSSTTAGFSGKSTGVGVIGGSVGDSDVTLPLCSGDSVLAFFERDEEASSDALRFVAGFSQSTVQALKCNRTGWTHFRGGAPLPLIAGPPHH